MIELGQTVGNYRITAKLGEGGMGAVFLAEHPVIGRKAALKVIHPQHARNRDVVARFVNEASAISRIGHEHIVEVTDFGSTPAGDFYFFMEYLEGEALADVIAREAPFEPTRAVAIAAQIADALTASHAHDVIHRDLKPENVFLVERGGDPAFVKVLDFGLAKLVHGGSPNETRSGIVMGTPYYMSPEQCEGRVVDERADIYALGVVLFEMLTGKLPFGGNGYAQILMKQISTPPPAARSLVPELPKALDAVLHRALAKNPDERFATMAAFRRALLEPSADAAVVSVSGDPSGRMRAARPMSRAEITLRRSHGAAPAPKPEGPAPGDVDDPGLDRIPRHRGRRTVAAALAAGLVGMALAAGATYGAAVRFTAAAPMPAAAPSKTVSVSFSSDPGGATVLGADGTPLGRTPLSIEVARADVPVVYELELSGFAPKTMSLIPNVPASLFALLRTEEPRAEPAQPSSVFDDDPAPPARKATAASRQRAVRTTASARAQKDDDGVLAPSFVK